ncbi:hypothetical protein LY76DRAFT_647642 [Colletotrichum caudatum]|nr:hypothetical protein LY76DRAFT_647642 [Colletotrichum caudatum]
MVRWCCGELPTVELPLKLGALELESNIQNTPRFYIPGQGSKKTSTDQYEALKIYFEACNFGGAGNIVSFEEKRLDDYKHSNAFAVDKSLVRNRELSSNEQEIRPDTDAIRTYLQDVEGIPMFGTGNVRVEAELLQIKLVRLAKMAAEHGWVRLMDAAPFAYSKGEITFHRRCPILRHIELVYSSFRVHNNRVELVQLFAKYPDFPREIMVYQDARPILSDPLLWHTIQYCPDGMERPLAV